MTLVAAAASGFALPPTPSACEGPDVDPWISDFRSRVEAYDRLYAFAVERFGAPVSCDGQIGDEFDGMLFGSLRFGFDGGVSYTVETMPLETSISVLRHPTGFADPDAVRAALAADAQATGLRIDWSTSPEVTQGDGEVVHTWWDPEPGLNASASLVWAGEALVGIRLSMAL